MSDTPAYQVLARKYRPETFADLVGQEAMVTTLKNAFKADRIAQAFMLTGIRGTGKTTTARIIAKGLNCIGPDGTGGPTTEPCGVCEHCTAISEGRHVDVLEMDAASHTGVQNIRDTIIETVAYRAASARYKIFIIDEVHMLSTSAFNALLKTLEEPPAHVKFLFATTEIRKVPVTVLSRCQRFDLRRIEPEDMIAMLTRIAGAEGREISPEALSLITRAAEGSARDATSLLDQALSHGDGSAEAVRAMMGLADRGRVLDLLEMIVGGDAAGALRELAQQYADGADPLAVMRDLAEITHWISVAKITPEAVDDPTVSPDEQARGRELASRIAMPVLTRQWQMLLKALDEVAGAPNAMMAAEMAIIRLTHVAELPTPGDLVKRLQDAPRPTGGGGGAPMQAGGAGGGATAMGAPSAPPPTSGGSGARAALAVAEAPNPLARYARFEDVVTLIRAHRDGKLLIDVETGIRLARYEPGRIEFTPAEGAPDDLAPRLAQRLRSWTGVRWAVTLTRDSDAATLAEVRDAEDIAKRARAAEHPVVRAILKADPEAKITDVKDAAEIATEVAAEALAEVEDEWDPFEEE